MKKIFFSEISKYFLANIYIYIFFGIYKMVELTRKEYNIIAKTEVF